MQTTVRTNPVLCKLLLCLLLLHIFLFSIAQARMSDKKVTIDANNIPLREVFLKITTQTGYEFTYTNDDVDEKQRITGKFVNQDVSDVLLKIFSGKGIEFELKGNVVVVKKSKKRAEEKTISLEKDSMVFINVGGKIVDDKNIPLGGATVILKSSSKATQSNSDGFFHLTQVPENATILISYTGFITREIHVRGQSNINIALQREILEMNEVAVVSTGYQKLPKERATGSFVQIDNELLNRRISTDILSRLEGITPGLLFNNNTASSLDGSINIAIRGHSTLFSNDQPLVIVDNFPYDGNINNINPNDIESITVLKDAAASSIWGVKSGNGVIVITTKKGTRNQKLRVEANANVTIGKRPDLFYSPNFIKSSDFIGIEKTLFSQGYYDADLTTGYTLVSPIVALLNNVRNGKISQSEADAQISRLNNIDSRYDVSNYLYQKSINQQYAINLRGGGNNSDYFLSFGYDNNRSNQVGNNNNRINISTDYNFYFNKNLQLSTGFNYTQTTNQNNGIIADLNAGSKTLQPYVKLKDGNGNNLPVEKDWAGAYKDTIGGGLLLNWQYKPLDELGNSNKIVKLIDNKINLGLKYSFLNNFRFELKYQYEKGITTAENYYSLDSYRARSLINTFTQINGTTVTHAIPLAGILDQNNNNLNSHRGRAQLNFGNKWSEKHEINAILGSEISQAITTGNANTIYGYNKGTSTAQMVDLVSDYPLLPEGVGRIPANFGLSKYTDRYISYFGNASYTYLSKYTFSTSGRIDKSNIFGVNTNQKSVPLYSVGLSWNFSRESFYHLSWLSYGKLRATYGYNGNVNKSVAALTTFSQTSAGNPYYGVPVTVINGAGNPELRWEKIRMINWGLDFGSANGNLSGSVEYYIKKGLDLFGNAELPPSTGLTSFTGNTSNTKGHGWDVVINTKNIDRFNFSWSSNFQFSYVIDKVTKYNIKFPASNYITFADGNSNTIIPITGKPIFSIYSLRWAGLDPLTGDPQGYDGNKISKDYGKLVSSTPADSLIYNGPSRPTIFGSLRNTFSYKGISLSLNIVYKLGYYFRRNSINYDALYIAGDMHRDYYKRWQKPGDEKTTNVPSLIYPPMNDNRNTFYNNSEILVSKGDHIRLQDISISYDIATSTFKNFPFSKLQIYSYINNVGILWKANHEGLDPDLYQSNLPIPRAISLGIKANF